MIWKAFAFAGVLFALGVFYWTLRCRLRLNRHSREQTMFYAMLGHELKTPLNGIVGFAELLCDAELSPEEQKQYAYNIRLSADTLLTMINNMLDCARLNAGQLPLHPRPTDLAGFISEFPVLLGPLLLAKNLRLEIDQPTALPLLSIDPGRTRQILLNLVGNAIKYSGDGVITLQALWETTDDHRGNLTFNVSDQGQGIPQEMQKRIFEPFVQQQQHASAGTGTGLGLFITVQLVKLMNGTIKLESEPGKGSCFTVTLPGIACG